MLQQYVARHENRPTTREISKVAVSCTRAGLPRIIPREARVMIRKGNVKTITLWLSIFNLYRFLLSTHDLRGIYKTITQNSEWRPSLEILEFIPIFKDLFFKGTSPEKKGHIPEITQKVSVAVNEVMRLRGTSFFAFLRSVHTWRSLANWIASRPKALEAFKFRIRKPILTKQEHKIREDILHREQLLQSFIRMVAWIDPKWFMLLAGPLNRATQVTMPFGGKMLLPQGTEIINKVFWLRYFRRPNVDLERKMPAPLGRLVKLLEAAGKVRVIAIVDPITQEILRPIHKWLFGLLRKIPQDGTFNQDAPLISLMAKIKSPGTLDKFSACCDMKAATDCLPVRLQVLILESVIGKMAHAWKSLLVDRPYYAGMKTLYYGTGQPMGALSSWAMLAVTHHFMWQFSAWMIHRKAKRSGPFKWYTDYAVLGDDSASLHRDVVDQYLKLCKDLKVGIGLAKSLVSPRGVIEFAKRFVTPRGDCSPVSLGEIIVSQKNFSTLANLPRKRHIRLADLISIYGKGFRVLGDLEKPLRKLSRRVRHLVLVIRSPWGSMPMPSLSQWLALDHTASQLKYVGIPLLQAVNRLRLKTIKIVDGNNMAYKMSNISSSSDTNDLTEMAKITDPQTFRVLCDVFFEPIRKEVFFKAVALLIEIHKFEKELTREVFYITMTSDIPERDLNKLFGKYLAFSDRLYLLKPDVYEQMVDKPFVTPSPKSIVKLWNSFRG